MSPEGNIWQRPEPWPQLPPGEVHVWHVTLAAAQPQLEKLATLLSPDERTRAARFHFEKDRLAHTASRGLTRMILGRHLGLEPAAIQLTYTEHGKPELVPGQRGDLHFNLSHSGGHALLAFTRGRPVGVDLEAVHPLQDMLGIADRFFAPGEIAVLRSLPEDQRARGFFNCWTRKEAFVKAHGEGLSFGLDKFEVTLRPGEPAQLLTIRGSEAAARRWRMQSLDLAEDLIAAVTVESAKARLRFWQWP